jgi:tetratricopeptide (TPR) repeat protein
MKKKDDNFEIRFYEGILKNSPNFVEVLIVLGDLYTKRGFYKKGLKVDLRLKKLRPFDPVVFYNLACDYSLLGQIDKAFEALKKAISLGYTDFEYLKRDKDLENLRKDKRFERIISFFKEKKFVS